MFLPVNRNCKTLRPVSNLQLFILIYIKCLSKAMVIKINLQNDSVIPHLLRNPCFYNQILNLQLLIQISPVRISRFYEINLPLPSIFFQFLFSFNCTINIRKMLIIYKHIHVILTGKTLYYFFLMLKYPFKKVICNSNI